MDINNHCLNNRTYSITGNSFEPLPEETLGNRKRGDPKEKTGAFINSSGDSVFRLYAPDAASVYVEFSSYISAVKRLKLPLVKQKNGMWEAVLLHNNTEIGPRDFSFYVDGVRVINPYCPVYFRQNCLTNYVELPDPSFDLHHVKNVPHGSVAYRVYWSTVFNEWKRCLVYLPAEYEHNPDKKYPVLWLNNGGSENETTWTYAGKAPEILDNLIASGDAEPMIVVMCNTMVRLPEEAARGKQELFGWRRMIIEDCIPFIEKEYRVYADKWHRAIAGNSMGGMATGFIAFEHPELFGSIGLFSTSIRCHDFRVTFEENTQLNWMIGHPERVSEQFKLFFRSHGDLETNRSLWTPDDEKWLEEQGISNLPCYKLIDYSPNFEHDWHTFRRALADFVPLLFK